MQPERERGLSWLARNRKPSLTVGLHVTVDTTARDDTAGF
jgi:hypothetical protein